MTLAVGRQGADGVIRVIADMRLTDPGEIRRGYPYAVLKNIILSPTTLVAYAGNAELAMSTIRSMKDASIDDLTSGLLDSAERAQNDVDYLLANADHGLQRITRRGIEPHTDASWIGDQAAFEAYQRAYHQMPLPETMWIEGVSPPRDELPDPEAMEPFIRMVTAIGALQREDSIKTVGEAFVSAFSRNGFRYEQQGFLAASHKQVIGAEWTDLNWGTAALGGFGYNLLHSAEPGIGLIGLYFPHAGLGLVYHPLAYDDPLVYRRVTHDEFRAAVSEDHGIEIDGPRLTQ